MKIKGSDHGVTHYSSILFQLLDKITKYVRPSGFLVEISVRKISKYETDALIIRGYVYKVPMLNNLRHSINK